MDIATYRTLFTVFLILTIVFAVLMIVLFFLFDIKKVISIKTGYAVRKSVKQVNEMNRKEAGKHKIKKKDGSWKSKEESPPNGNVWKAPKPVLEEATAALKQENRKFIPDEQNAEEGFEIIETKLIKASGIIIDRNGKIKEVM